MFTPQELQAVQNDLLTQIVATARAQPGKRLPIRDEAGRVVATVEAHDAPTRPQDMPRRLRPKQKLSKRGRDAAKREKLRAA